mmetsp:Transcript_8270/g.20167  ORF Transcript_8270/g.20167 Transcript_8270/m.20167 type:complete len:100 (-) Transcript_8270:1198-1497(-)
MRTCTATCMMCPSTIHDDIHDEVTFTRGEAERWIMMEAALLRALLPPPADALRWWRHARRHTTPRLYQSQINLTVAHTAHEAHASQVHVHLTVHRTPRA